MYINKNTGLTEYETIEDFLKSNITYCAEDENKFYILTDKKQYYEDCIWVIDKKNKNISWMSYIDYMLNIMDNTKNISEGELKKRL